MTYRGIHQWTFVLNPLAHLRKLMDLPDDYVSEGTAELTAYIANALAAPTPDDVLEKARHHLLDTVAAMVSGSRLRAGLLATTYVRSMAGAPLCTVVGADFLTTPVDAALANGMMAHADETDDSHLGGRFPPS
jgi:2-methylcitrate dehydratase PrpD